MIPTDLIDLDKGLLFHASFKNSIVPEVGTLLNTTKGNPQIVQDNTLNRNVLYCDSAAVGYDPSNLPLGDVPFSISIWIKIAYYHNHSVILAWGVIPYDPTVKGIFIGKDSGSPTVSFSPNSANSCEFEHEYDQWYHIVGVYPGNGQLSTLYINKQIVDQRNTDWSKHQTNAYFEIGLAFWARWDSNTSYIANARIYDRALSKGEIVYLYDNVL